MALGEEGTNLMSEDELNRLFSLAEGRVAVWFGDSEKLEEELRKEASELGYKVSEPHVDELVRFSHHLGYWWAQDWTMERFKDLGMARIVLVENGKEEEAIARLKELPYVTLAERMYAMHIPE